MKMFTLLISIMISTMSCDNDDNAGDDVIGDDIIDVTVNPNVDGMNYVLSDRSFDETYDTLVTALNNNPNITIIAEVDHQENAASVDQVLNPTRVVFFGNPALGTPLMQSNQQAGLDLPQRMLVYEDDNGDVFVGYNNTDYLGSRHSVGDVETLATIAMALENFSTTAGDSELNIQTTAVIANQNVTNTISNQSFIDTYDALIAAINDNPNLTLIQELDHSANAASVELDLLPTRVVIFGNPNLGTPVMQTVQTAALDLPQKMLVYENEDGVTTIAFNNTSIFIGRHGVTGNEETLATILGALEGLAATAASK